MKTLLLAAVLATCPVSAPAQDEQGPAAHYQQLSAAYSTASGNFRAAATDEQRKQAVEQIAGFAATFLDLSDKHPADPVALPALRQAVQAVLSADSLAQQAWEVNRESFPDCSPSDSSRRIVALLLRDHLESDQLAPICDRMRFACRREFEQFLSAVLDASPHRNVQGLACLALAQLLRNQLHIVDRVNARPEWIERYDVMFGREHFQAMRQSGRTALAQRVEALYGRATKFVDVVNFPYAETVAEKAQSELFDIRHLSVGKLAPDIQGQDQHGQDLRLSDHRGKVVLLYFWNEH